jgi:hypothetical protein
MRAISFALKWEVRLEPCRGFTFLPQRGISERFIPFPEVRKRTGRSTASTKLPDRSTCREWCATPEQSSALGGRGPLLAVDDLSVVARWLAEAAIYIGNDSGITHLAAAALGTPVIALFGHSDARICARGQGRVEVLEAPAMNEIEVDSVFATAARVLRQGRAYFNSAR